MAVLLTGMSAVGKSTTLAELARRGYATLDTDDGPWIQVVDGERLWDEERLREELSLPRPGPLFVAGTVANQGRLYPRFAAVVLLSVPDDVRRRRLATRTTNEFGRTPEELARIERDVREVEPVLRAGATHEIVTTGSVAEVADRIVALAGPLSPSPRASGSRPAPGA